MRSKTNKIIIDLSIQTRCDVDRLNKKIVPSRNNVDQTRGKNLVKSKLTIVFFLFLFQNSSVGMIELNIVHAILLCLKNFDKSKKFT